MRSFKGDTFTTKFDDYASTCVKALKTIDTSEYKGEPANRQSWHLEMLLTGLCRIRASDDVLWRQRGRGLSYDQVDAEADHHAAAAIHCDGRPWRRATDYLPPGYGAAQCCGWSGCLACRRAYPDPFSLILALISNVEPLEGS